MTFIVSHEIRTNWLNGLKSLQAFAPYVIWANRVCIRWVLSFEFIGLPISRLIDNIGPDTLIFLIIADDVVMIIGLPVFYAR
ncbi:hypothetical protein [Ancylomarina subtilis]|uniref:hypothetical protein n=1 Tax=Ancylomarina subtilis TaxID=1639035 RepID=UPI00102959C8|nr:hypothetical protein [Ancylomarina subtilis]